MSLSLTFINPFNKTIMYRISIAIECYLIIDFACHIININIKIMNKSLRKYSLFVHLIRQKTNFLQINYLNENKQQLIQISSVYFQM
jgi:hypothetical protein